MIIKEVAPEQLFFVKGDVCLFPVAVSDCTAPLRPQARHVRLWHHHEQVLYFCTPFWIWSLTSVAFCFRPSSSSSCSFIRSSLFFSNSPSSAQKNKNTGIQQVEQQDTHMVICRKAWKKNWWIKKEHNELHCSWNFDSTIQIVQQYLNNSK